MGLVIPYTLANISPTNLFDSGGFLQLDYYPIPNTIQICHHDRNGLDVSTIIDIMQNGQSTFNAIGFLKLTSEGNGTFALYHLQSISQPFHAPPYAFVLGVTQFYSNLTFSGSNVTLEFIPTFDPLAHVDVFYNSGTWHKPAGAGSHASVTRVVIAGGGGGGGGARGATNSVRGGGGAGGGGGCCIFTDSASGFAATETVHVGVGGAGGTRATASSSVGGAGTGGGYSEMTMTTGPGGYSATANGGSGGAGGTLTAGGAGGMGGSVTGSYAPGGAGGNGGGAVNGTGGSAGNLGMSGAGGGGGWGITASNVNSQGGYGAASGGVGGPWGSFDDSGGDGYDGSPGANFNLPNGVPKSFGGGGGGGGTMGLATTGTVYHKGGRGNLFGGGGGGGGGCTNGADSQNPGGPGADGIVIVITNF